MLERIGAEKRGICYDGKEHLLRVMDYAVKLTGNTYPVRCSISAKGLYWDDIEKAWCGIVNTPEELLDIYHEYSGRGINVFAKANWRIADGL